MWQSIRVGVALGVSIFVALIGLLAWAETGADASTCSNAVVGALASHQCSEVVGIHDLGLAGLGIGLLVSVLIIVALIVRGRQS